MLVFEFVLQPFEPDPTLHGKPKVKLLGLRQESMLAYGAKVFPDRVRSFFNNLWPRNLRPRRLVPYAIDFRVGSPITLRGDLIRERCHVPSLSNSSIH